MTTIFILNVVSSVLATVGIGGFFLHRKRQARSTIRVQPIYVRARTTRPPPRA